MLDGVIDSFDKTTEVLVSLVGLVGQIIRVRDVKVGKDTVDVQT